MNNPVMYSPPQKKSFNWYVQSRISGYYIHILMFVQCMIYIQSKCSVQVQEAVWPLCSTVKNVDMVLGYARHLTFMQVSAAYSQLQCNISSSPLLKNN